MFSSKNWAVPVKVGRNCLTEIEHMLRLGGVLLLSPPCRAMSHSGDAYHTNEYQPESIRAMVPEHSCSEKVTSRNVDILTVRCMRCREKHS